MLIGQIATTALIDVQSGSRRVRTTARARVCRYACAFLKRPPVPWGDSGVRSDEPGITVEIACLNTIWRPDAESRITTYRSND